MLIGGSSFKFGHGEVIPHAYSVSSVASVMAATLKTMKKDVAMCPNVPIGLCMGWRYIAPGMALRRTDTHEAMHTKAHAQFCPGNCAAADVMTLARPASTLKTSCSSLSSI